MVYLDNEIGVNGGILLVYARINLVAIPHELLQDWSLILMNFIAHMKHLHT